jgi:hypothetical protein
VDELAFPLRDSADGGHSGWVDVAPLPGRVK